MIQKKISNIENDRKKMFPEIDSALISLAPAFRPGIHKIIFKN